MGIRFVIIALLLGACSSSPEREKYYGDFPAYCTDASGNIETCEV